MICKNKEINKGWSLTTYNFVTLAIKSINLTYPPHKRQEIVATQHARHTIAGSYRHTTFG